MRIIISPAKKMKVDEDTLAYESLPVFLDDTARIMKWIKTLNLEETKALWGCNEKLAKQNYERFQKMRLDSGLTPAILSYEGIQYQYMAPTVFEDTMLSYVQKHLRILSGFYGVLKPMDGVTPYRLEMQAKTDIDGVEGLYDFWGSRLYEEVQGFLDSRKSGLYEEVQGLNNSRESRLQEKKLNPSRVIVNLASKEYSKCIEPYLQPEDRFITCIFGELSGGKVVQKGTYAKMARGEMVRFMAENRLEEPEGMREFHGLGYRFAETLSTEKEYVFVK